jgi:hypothetical protein
MFLATAGKSTERVTEVEFYSNVHAFDIKSSPSKIIELINTKAGMDEDILD